MARFARLLLTAVLLAGAGRVTAGGSVLLSGRIETYTSTGPANDWNYERGSGGEGFRLMLASEIETSAGVAAYVKGATRWQGDKAQFRLEQGSCAYADSSYPLHVAGFYKERRFFTGEQLLPLLYDDTIDDNRFVAGMRVQARLGRRVQVLALASALGRTGGRANRLAHLRGSMNLPGASVALSYLYERLLARTHPHHGIVMVETGWGLGRLHALVSWAQSSFGSSNPGAPSLSIYLDRAALDRFSSLFSPAACLLAEVRLRRLRLGQPLWLSTVAEYFLYGSEYRNSNAPTPSDLVGYRLSAYFSLAQVCFEGRVRYQLVEGLRRPGERSRRWQVDVWALAKGGEELVVRGGWEGRRGRWGSEDVASVLTGAIFHTSSLRSGFYLLLADSGRAGLDPALAWDERIPLGRDFAFTSRVVLARSGGWSQAVFARIEYRPHDRLWAYVSYGDERLGYSPFLLDEGDLPLVSVRKSLYSVVLRGDF